MEVKTDLQSASSHGDWSTECLAVLPLSGWHTLNCQRSCRDRIGNDKICCWSLDTPDWVASHYVISAMLWEISSSPVSLSVPSGFIQYYFWLLWGQVIFIWGYNTAIYLWSIPSKIQRDWYRIDGIVESDSDQSIRPRPWPCLQQDRCVSCLLMTWNTISSPHHSITIPSQGMKIF